LGTAEFHDLELGDARRTQRLIKLVADLSAQPTGSIPLACGGWPETKAAYRLLDNPAVEWREMLAVYAASDGPCYRCLFPEPPDPATIPSCAQAGVLGTVPGLFGTLQAHEAIKLILGIGEPLIGALLTVDLLTMRFQKLRLPRDPHCPVCGESPTIRTLAATECVCAGANDAALPWLGVEAGQQRPGLRWIDVRTLAEFAAGHIPGAIHAPLDQLEEFIAQVGPDDHLLLYCQRGGRTVQAYHQLEAKLKGRLWLLRGGYEAWLNGGLGD
jgi:adenylyltransferase/sulfurtransferase